jgi:hypothetical protein
MKLHDIARKPATFMSVGLLAAIPLANFNCGQNDADIGGRNTGPAEVVNMPNHFSSIAVKCDGPNRVYESDHGNDNDGRPGGLAVVPNDPRCGGEPRQP